MLDCTALFRISTSRPMVSCQSRGDRLCVALPMVSCQSRGDRLCVARPIVSCQSAKGCSALCRASNGQLSVKWCSALCRSSNGQLSVKGCSALCRASNGQLSAKRCSALCRDKLMQPRIATVCIIYAWHCLRCMRMHTRMHTYTCICSHMYTSTNAHVHVRWPIHRHPHALSDAHVWDASWIHYTHCPCTSHRLGADAVGPNLGWSHCAAEIFKIYKCSFTSFILLY